MSRFECVPNFSEGRDAGRLARIVAPARERAGVVVLDTEQNADHHRAVVTLVGDGPALVDVVFAMMEVATREIDLTQHRGEHPRIGATDVVPFVPLGDARMEEAVALAESLGERVGRELGIPVYLYGAAARRPERTDLARVREGQFEGLRTLIESDPNRAPDFGPRRLHPTAGAVAIGARPILIAFNAYLATADVGVAKQIARAVRARDGGLPEVKALGFEIRERGVAQVSMNLTDYRVTPPHVALEAVRTEASRRGTSVTDSEIVGLIPEDALFAAAEAYLALRGFDRNLVLERKIRAADRAAPGGESIRSFVERLSARRPTPGGGSAAALAGALGTALAEMVVRYSVDPKAPDPELERLVSRWAARRQRFLELVELDSESYEGVRTARAARRARPDDRETAAAHRAALWTAARVPLETARSSAEVASDLREVRPKTKAALSSDLTTALALLDAARLGALANAAINRDDLAAQGEAVESLTAEIRELERSH